MLRDMRCATIRAALSTALAAASGTIIWIGLLGYADWANTAGETPANAAATIAQWATRTMIAMTPPAFVGDAWAASIARNYFKRSMPSSSARRSRFCRKLAGMGI